ncbi:hypothetical protein [Aeoliella sp.]|uniref:hypothetical protein n=1 Tax=Aeoliella sp. TaxID=2795800 RepID=UPI003CCBF828
MDTCFTKFRESVLQSVLWFLCIVALCPTAKAGTVAVQYGPPSGIVVAPVSANYSGPPLSLFGPNYEGIADVTTGEFRSFAKLDSSNNDLPGFPSAYSQIVQPYYIFNDGSSPLVIPQGAFKMDVKVTYTHYAGFDGASATYSDANFSVTHHGQTDLAGYRSAVQYEVNPAGTATLLTNYTNPAQAGGGIPLIHGFNEQGLRATLAMPEITLNPGESLTFSTLLTAVAVTNGDGIEAIADAYYGGNGAQLSLLLPATVSPSDVLTPVPFNWISYALPGDFNHDGKVNLADYTVWRNNLGAPAGTLPNDTAGGTIGAAQYDLWRMNLGQSVGPVAAVGNSTVPEPATLVTVLIAMCSVASRRVGDSAGTVLRHFVGSSTGRFTHRL